MKNRFLHILPYPAKSKFTVEDVREIKKIKLDDAEYDEVEIEWMKRALADMEKDRINMMRYSIQSGRPARMVDERIAHFKVAIKKFEERKVNIKNP